MCVDSTKLPPAKVRTVEELLSLLQEMPHEDPPADLATKTLRRIEENAPQPPPVQPGEGTQPIAG